VGVLRPLRFADFRRLWIGTTVSLIGDGIYIVAMALQVLELDNRAGTLALVGIAWSVPQVVLLLASGALSDRLDRRLLMIAGDLIRLAAVAAIGALSIAGVLTVPILIGLVVVFGAGQALFGPSFHAIVPSIVPEEVLVEANALGQIVRPASLMLIGPLIGGIITGTLGTGAAFLVDGGTFAWSAFMIWRMQARTAPDPADRDPSASLWREVKEGLGYVAAHRWLLVGMFGATLSLLATWGPWETLVPFIVKNDLVTDHSRDGIALGLVYGAGGIGAVAAGLYLGQRAVLPRRPLTLLYLAWALGMFMTAFFGVVNSVWQAMIVGFVAEASIAVLVVIWLTLMQRLVPNELLGRVSSLDWMITIAGLPISFALVGPLAETFGADVTLIGAGIVGGTVTVLLMFVPGARDPERDGSLEGSDEDPPEVDERSSAPT
jgi:DHA3 family tetracycline resistance protein-like MFS transporter